MRASIDRVTSSKSSMEIGTSAEADPVQSDPVYQLLYADNVTNLVNFALFAHPLAFTDLVKNSDYLMLIVASEKGPTVNYTALPSMIRDLRLAARPLSSMTADFLEQLLRLHDNWKIAALTYNAYHTFSLMLNGFFIHQDSPQLLSLETGMSAAAKQIIASHRTHLSTPTSRNHLSQTWTAHHNTYVNLSQRLYAMKTCPAFWHHMQALQSFVPAAMTTVVTARREYSDEADRTDRARRVSKEQNLLSAHLALGNEAAVSMEPNAEEALEEAVEEMQEEYTEVEQWELDGQNWEWLGVGEGGREVVRKGDGSVMERKMGTAKGKGLKGGRFWDPDRGFVTA